MLASITGHLSRRMLEHYCQIQIGAKRHALDALDVQRGARPRHDTVTSQFAFAGLAAFR